MNRLDRRALLASLGFFGGAAALGIPRGDGGEASGEASQASAPPERPGWRYTPLDPQATSELTYQMYADGGCMYAVVGSVVSQLAARHGEPFRSFPYEMMRYGAGGGGEWGSLCGVVNGAMALTGLFHNEPAKERREALSGAFCQWYEQTSLPHFTPTEPLVDCAVPPTVAGSVLCHVSVARWCEASGVEAFSPEKKERCRRLAADGAEKIVEMLNADATASSLVLPVLTPAVASCVACHGKTGMANANGQMSCQTCHQIADPHP